MIRAAPFTIKEIFCFARLGTEGVNEKTPRARFLFLESNARPWLRGCLRAGLESNQKKLPGRRRPHLRALERARPSVARRCPLRRRHHADFQFLQKSRGWGASRTRRA